MMCAIAYVVADLWRCAQIILLVALRTSFTFVAHSVVNSGIIFRIRLLFQSILPTHTSGLVLPLSTPLVSDG